MQRSPSAPSTILHTSNHERSRPQAMGFDIANQMQRQQSAPPFDHNRTGNGDFQYGNTEGSAGRGAVTGDPSPFYHPPSSNRDVPGPSGQGLTHDHSTGTYKFHQATSSAIPAMSSSGGYGHASGNSISQRRAQGGPVASFNREAVPSGHPSGLREDDGYNAYGGDMSMFTEVTAGSSIEDTIDLFTSSATSSRSMISNYSMASDGGVPSAMRNVWSGDASRLTAISSTSTDRL